MMAVDTSALMAILLGEPDADRCVEALAGETEVLMSAGTLAEALIVAGRRNLGDDMARLVEAMGFEIVSVTAVMARTVSDAYARWGKGVHPAALNFGDCFAYALARQRGCRLLFVDVDFARTDLESASPGR